MQTAHKTPKYRDIVYAAIALLIALSVSRLNLTPHFTTHFLGGASRDAGLYVWLCEIFRADPLRTLKFESNAFYPYGLSVAWSDNFFIPGGLFYLLTNAGLSEAGAYNLIILFSQFLNGFCTFLMTRALGGATHSAIISGLLFMCSGYLSAGMGHPQLQFAWPLPLSIIALTLLKQEKFKKSGFLFGLSLTCAFFTAVYYSVFIAIIAVFGIPVVAASARIKFNKDSLVGFLAPAFLAASPIIPTLPAYLAVRETFSARALYEGYYFSANSASYISHSSLSSLYGFTSSWSHDEGHLGSGFLLVLIFLILLFNTLWRSASGRMVAFSLLGLLTISIAPRSNDAARLLTTSFAWLTLVTSAVWCRSQLSADERKVITPLVLFIGLAFLILSFGPIGNPAKGQVAWSPYAALHFILPGMDAIRAAGRFGIVAILSVSAAVPLLLERKLGTGLGGRIAVAAIGLISFVENRVTAYPLDEPPQTRKAVENLKSHMASGDAALVLPMASSVKDGQVESWGDYADRNVRYMLWFSDSKGEIVNGYSGQRSKLMLELPGIVADFPSDESIANLQRIVNLKYVLIDSSNFPEPERNRLFSKIGLFNFSTVEVNDGDVLLGMPTIPPLKAGEERQFLIPPDKEMFLNYEAKGNACSVAFRYDIRLGEGSADSTWPETGRISGIKGRVPLHPNERLSVRPAILTLKASCDTNISFE